MGICRSRINDQLTEAGNETGGNLKDSAESGDAGQGHHVRKQLQTLTISSRPVLDVGGKS